MVTILANKMSTKKSVDNSELLNFELTHNDQAENRTAYYIASISLAFEKLYGKSKITYDEYSALVLELPCDLACKLRLVPDSRLSSRLSHLYAVYLAVASDYKFSFATDYSIVSVEGSNKVIPFDADLVILNNKTATLHVIDFTSSNNEQLLKRKQQVVESNISMSKVRRTTAHVVQFDPIMIDVDINFGFVSKEPGTIGLRIIDKIASLGEDDRKMINKQMYSCYTATNLALSELDMTSAPGDYKDIEPSDAITEMSSNLVSVQNDVDSLKLLKISYKENPEYYPYMKSMAVLAKNSQKYKKLIPIDASKTLESRDLQSNLSSLSDNWLCNALRIATLTESVVAVDDSNNITYLPDFPCSPSEKYLPASLIYKACVRQKNNHVFTILMNPNAMDEKLRRTVCHDVPKKDKFSYNNSTLSDDDLVEDFVTKAIDDYKDDINGFTCLSIDQPKDTIWKKIATISALASNDLENLGRSTCALLDNTLDMMEKIYLGGCISHFYEVTKSILASLKVSPGNNDYYVGVNGSFESVTIVKMSSTLDSFTKTNYSVIFRPDRINNKRRTRLDGSYNNGIFSTKFYTIDPNQLSYYLRLPMVIMSFATWELENNLENGGIQSGMAPKILFDTTIHALVNRDQFAQASEQIRYFYMSSIGYGGSAASISEKTEFMVVRHSWETLYMLRSFKLAISLSTLSCKKMLSNIENRKTHELSVAFPHSSYPSKSFSQTISSMYVCNTFNKFRAFHEISDAICYMEILAELDIYKSRVNENINAVSGLSPKMIEHFNQGTTQLIDYIRSPAFIDDEVQFSLSLSMIKSNRYSGSLSYIIGATLFHTDVNSGIIDNIYSKLNMCPIEACTMKGAMDVGESKQESQGLRAASAVLENMIRTYNHDPKTINKSVLGAANLFDIMAKKDMSMSIFQCVMRQICSEHSPYRYRIVDKDQKGHREISVLNFEFRIGALFVETISRELSHAVSDVEVVHNPNKDKIVEDAIKASFDESKTRKGTYCYDNSDQKRWGPNHNMNFFSYFLYGMLKSDPGLCRMSCLVLDKIFDKRAKFPEPLINLIMKKGKRDSNSKIIDKFIKTCAPKMDNQIFETVVPQGMCQGITHDTSSVMHAIKVKATMNLARMVEPSLSIKYFTTSDDSEGLIYIPENMDKVKCVKVVHVAGLRTGNLFNIVRSNPKSAFNFHIAELNSIFYKRGIMATPSLKQRISKIDVGFGTNHIEDFLSCLSAAANYLSSGGSYMGAYICSILNLTMHTEQWLRWAYAKSDNYYKPVEMGGFPVIEPLSTIISGGASNLYLRSSHVLSPENYSRVLVSTLLCPPERLSLADFSRSGSDSAKKTFADQNLTVYKGTGPFGLFQTVRTDRKLSVFERRHGLSKWIIPDGFANINRSSASASDFLFTIFRTTSVNTLDTNLGVNSFYIRMAEPWVSYKRKCFKVSSNSPFAPTFGGADSRISHEDMHNTFMAKDLASATFELDLAFRRTTRQPEYEILEAQLTIRLSDAKSLMEYLKDQEAESFRNSIISPSIQTITLRGQSAYDSDLYFTSVVKAVAGEKSRDVINKYRRHNGAYDEIDVTTPTKGSELVDAIIFADNAVAIYNKFVRRDTKMLIPNNVDDMRELCVDILKNKFTERMGINVTGVLDLHPDRAKPHAHTKWYQELLKLSEKRERQIAEKALASINYDTDLIGVKSERGLITNRDMFQIATVDSPEKSVLISAKTKSSFIPQVKTWMGAKVKLTFDRETISNLLAGRLTFSHDYFLESNTFTRHAKRQYVTVESRSSLATHIITTTMKQQNNRTITHYKHNFVFNENVDMTRVTAKINPGYENEKWAIELCDSINKIQRSKTYYSYKVEPGKHQYGNASKYRKTMSESDVFMFGYVTPGTEFKMIARPKSLSLTISDGFNEFPVGYAMPLTVNKMTHEIELTHKDLTIATKAFSSLKNRSDNFKKSTMSNDPKLVSFIDFILVESTIDTPNAITNAKCLDSEVKVLNSQQADILKTMLINTKNIGVHYSAHRFNSHLLNMGHRRKHNFTHFTRKILGSRADLNSEMDDTESVNDEFIVTGKTEANYVNEDDSIDVVLTRDIDNNTMEVLNNTTDISSKLSWADIVEEEQSIPIIDQESDFFVTSREEISFEDSEDEDDDLTRTKTVNSDNNDLNVTKSVSTPTSAQFTAANMLNNLMGSVSNNMNFDDLFDIEDNESDLGAKITNDILDDMNTVFKKSLENTYGKIVDDKDKGLKSIVTGHTVSQNIETARPIIAYIRNWLETAGKMKEFDFIEAQDCNVSKITSVYQMMDSLGVLDMSNPMITIFNSSSIKIPVELSSLAVISTMYL